MSNRPVDQQQLPPPLEVIRYHEAEAKRGLAAERELAEAEIGRASCRERV